MFSFVYSHHHYYLDYRQQFYKPLLNTDNNLRGPLLFPLLCAGGRDEVVGGDGGVLPRGVLLVPLVLWPGGGVGRCLTALSRGLAAVLLFSRAFAIRS